MIDSVADIFVNELPDDFCSLMGCGFLRKYFLPYFLTADPHIGYVARHQERVAGFVLGARASRYYDNFIKKHFVVLALYSLLACVRDIRKLSYFIDVSRVMFGGDAFRPLDSDLELLYISVSNESQGSGIGLRLVAELLQKTQRLGFDRCVVKTFEASENANRFYQKCGFEPLHRSRGRIWYSHSTTARKEGSES